VLDHHDETKVTVTLYLQHYDAAEDLRADKIRLVGDMSDEALADAIRADGIDVLVDLWGHTVDGRLGVFARRAAPVQVSWLNYVQTTGVPEIDYLIHADSMNTPEAADQCVEEIWRIGPIISPFRPDPRPAPSPTPALANGYVTFGSYNHPARLNDQTIAAWARILLQTPHSRLILRYKYFVDEVLQNTLLMRFAARGVRPDFIDFKIAEPQPAYYQSYAEIDIALDPSPTPGGTTSCDAVANGVPLLTMAGQDYFSRIGLAVVAPLGLDELIAQDWDDYVARAVALANDTPRLDALRKRVRDAFDASGRRDEAGFTTTLEAAFFDMFERWRAQRITQAA
jgi:predicted O-linked N-acetylglucosamine transferase (SPINDLY family)